MRMIPVCPECLYVRHGQKYCNTRHPSRRVVVMHPMLWAQLPPTEDNLAALRRFDELAHKHNELVRMGNAAYEIGDRDNGATYQVEAAKIYVQIKNDTEGQDVAVRVNLLIQITPEGEPVWDGLRKGGFRE